MHRLFLFPFSFFLAVSVFAQDDKKSNHLDFMFQIKALSGEMATVVTNPFFERINKSVGTVRGIYDATTPSRNEEIGVAVLSNIYKNEIRVSLKEELTGQTNIQVGDLVIFSIEEYETHNLFFHLSRLSIELLDVYGEPIYDKNMALSDALNENTLLEILQADIALTGIEMRKQMGGLTLKSGLYQNEDIFDAMENCRSGDLKLFLSYVIERPKKYVGHQWKISEIYATWLDGGTPLPLTAFLEAIAVSQEDSKRITQLFNSVEADLLPAYAEKLRETATDFSEIKDQKEQALLYATAALKCSQFSKDAEGEYWGNFTIGSVLRKLGRFEEAIQQYEIAIEGFEKIGQNIPAFAAYNNLGMTYSDMNETKQALKYLKIASEKQIPYLKESSDASVQTTAALTLRNIGQVYHKEKKYDKALYFFEEALALINIPSNELSAKRKATILVAMSETYQAIGDMDKSKECLKSAVNVFKLSKEMKEE